MLIETSKIANQREKTMKRTELINNYKNKSYTHGNSLRRENEGTEEIFESIITDSSPKLMPDNHRSKKLRKCQIRQMPDNKKQANI